jgi:hypothetical protein
MLVAAQQYCQESISIPIKFTTILCEIQKITSQQLSILKKHQQIWFINASLSLHYMPKELKIFTMKKLADLSAYCLISESNYNHDCQGKDTSELIYSVTENYGFVIQDVLKSSVSETFAPTNLLRGSKPSR